MRPPLLLTILLLAGWLNATAAELAKPRAVDGRIVDEPARMVKQKEAVYPEHLVDNGIFVAATVISTIEIDATGQVTTAKVHYASHPAFVPAALTAIFASKYAPARIGGQPVASYFTYTITFNVVARLGGMVGQDVARQPGKIPGLPPDFDYDSPPVLSAYCDPVYPRELLEKEVKGEAAVRVVLDAKGGVTTGEILSATQPELGAVFLAAVETWHFTPAQRHGAATATVVDLRHKFVPAGFRRPGVETRALRELRRGGKAFVEPAALDQPLRPLYQVDAQYPRTLARTRETGEAVVEFLICDDGQVVLPKVLSATRPEFGLAAATAVQQWVYAPPRTKEKEATVRHQLTFGFSDPNAAAVVR